MRTKISSIANCVVLSLMAGGCGSASHEDYVPSESAGRQAVETALAAWQNGKTMQRIEGQDAAAVEPQDSDWKAGKKLTGFSVEKEVPTTQGPKQFAVRLSFQGDAEPIDTVYYVVGRDPMWVFRDRDYKKTTGM
ncbi:MAG: hypothetical protein L0228_12140 [Planctomycetes bacterium]|nr:hypothetical protein [Planctomycetota bacterium]